MDPVLARGGGVFVQRNDACRKSIHLEKQMVETECESPGREPSWNSAKQIQKGFD